MTLRLTWKPTPRINWINLVTKIEIVKLRIINHKKLAKNHNQCILFLNDYINLKLKVLPFDASHVLTPSPTRIQTPYEAPQGGAFLYTYALSLTLGNVYCVHETHHNFWIKSTSSWIWKKVSKLKIQNSNTFTKGFLKKKESHDARCYLLNLGFFFLFFASCKWHHNAMVPPLRWWSNQIEFVDSSYHWNTPLVI